MTNPPPAAALATLLATARPPFLMLSVCCVALGLALALPASGEPLATAWLARAGLAMLGALAAHVSVNALNEYADFRSGLDLITERTPFSGGSGALPANPRLASSALALGLLSLLLCAGIGLAFLALWPAQAVPLAGLGLAGLVLVAGYSPWITRNPWLCLVAPGLGFGPLMVAGTQLAAGGRIDPAGWGASAVMFFLVNNLLLLNQFPDVQADRQVGRRTLPIVLGLARSARVLAIGYALAHGALAMMVLAHWLPVPAALGLLGAPLAMRACLLTLRPEVSPRALNRAMAANVAGCLLTPALIALGVTMHALGWWP